jgi:hypothetical protein
VDNSRGATRRHASQKPLPGNGLRGKQGKNEGKMKAMKDGFRQPGALQFFTG